MLFRLYNNLLNNWSPWRLRAEIKRLEEVRARDEDHIKRAHAALTAKEPNAGKAIEILENAHPGAQYVLRNLFKLTYGNSVKDLIPQPIVLNTKRGISYKKSKKRKKNY